MASGTTAASSPTSTLLPGQSPPLAALTDTNRSGIVLITTSLCLIFALLSITIRLYVRLQFRHQIDRDDFASFISMIFSFVQSVIVFVQAGSGFGKSAGEISESNMVSWQKGAFASDILYIFTLWLTKCSVALLFIRLTPEQKHIFASYVVLGGSTLLMVVSEILVALRCDTSHPWIFVGNGCNDLFQRWQVVTAFDVITEVFLFGLAMYMLQGLKLKIEKKLVVLSAFALRLPVIVPAILRLHWLGIEFSSPDPSLDGVVASVFTQIQLSYAIFATTTPILRPFMGALNTHYGGPNETRITPTGTRRSDKSSGQPLSSLVSSRNKSEQRNLDKAIGPQVRWDHTEYNVQVSSAENENRSLHSSDSRRMFISKNTEWTVDYEEPSPIEPRKAAMV
ncbi:hypothetical protein VMCG_07079 [Cytospora schulzeri]|uniref:Rhodopsin domain-containing protein n=1 Tax=Cytospora schulzeri TaxID=448051 RepID=A0A423W3X9_9PEZI|nr:hypothetical protein VMCG_07079 [Valsa malicola]